MLDSGRGKRRLKDNKGARVLEGRLQGSRALGASAAALSSCLRGFKDYDKERTLESSAKTLRSPEVKGEVSRFKLRK